MIACNRCGKNAASDYRGAALTVYLPGLAPCRDFVLCHDCVSGWYEFMQSYLKYSSEHGDRWPDLPKEEAQDAD